MAGFLDAFGGGGTAEGGDLPQLSETERREFDETTFDKIQAITDVNKLARLEAYMRREEFFTTADVAQARLKSLRGSAGEKESAPPARPNSNAELDKVLEELNSWEASVKGADKALKTDAALAEEEAAPIRRHIASKVGKAAPIEEPAATKPQTGKADAPETKKTEEVTEKAKRAKASKDVRSGAEYYKQWDKVTDDLEKGADASPRESKPTPSETKPAAEPAPEEVPGPTLSPEAADRLVDAAWKKATVEREWLANREREKGNELFKSQEFKSSLAAYTLAIRLMPKSAAAFANRAATHLKLKQYKDAEADCSKALELDPAYQKALRRRATAKLELGAAAAAVTDLEAAQRLDPENAEIAEMLQKARAKVAKKEGEQRPLKRMQIEEIDGEDSVSTPGKEGTGAESRGTDEEDETGALSGVKAGDGNSNGHVDGREQENGNGSGSGSGNGSGSGEGKGTGNGKRNGSGSGKGNGKGDGNGNGAGEGTRGPVDESIVGTSRQGVAAGESVSGVRTEAADKTGMGDASKRNETGQKEGLSKPEGVAERTDAEKQADTWREKGNVLYKRGDALGAEACYTQSLTYSRNAAALSNRAMCRNKFGRYREAEEDASAAIAADPTYVKAYHRRAAARRALGKKEEAMEDYKVVSRAMPGNAGLQDEIRSLEGELEECMYIPPRKGALVVEEVEDGKPSPKAQRPQKPTQASTSAPSETAPKGRNPPANQASKPEQRAEASEKSGLKGINEGRSSVADAHLPVAESFSGTQTPEEERTPGPGSKAGVGLGDAEKTAAPARETERPSASVAKAAGEVESGSVPTSTSTEREGTEPERNGTETGRNGTESEQNGTGTEQAEREKEEGNRLFKQKDLPGAIEHYSRAIELQPGSAAYYGNRAMCHLQLNEYEKVVGDTTRAIELDPKYTKAYYRRALGRKGLGQYELALADLNLVQKKLPKDKQVTEEVLAVTDLYMRRFEKLSSPSPVTAAGAFSSPINLPAKPPISDPEQLEPSPKKLRESTPPGAGPFAEPSVPAKTVLPPWLKEQLAEQVKQGGLKPQEMSPPKDVTAAGVVRQVGSLTNEVFENKPPLFESNQDKPAFSVGSFDKKTVSPKTPPRSAATRKRASPRSVVMTPVEASTSPDERVEEGESALPETSVKETVVTKGGGTGGAETAPVEPPAAKLARLAAETKEGVNRAAAAVGESKQTTSRAPSAKTTESLTRTEAPGGVAVKTAAAHIGDSAASTTKPDSKPLPPRPRSALDFERACARLDTPERIAAYLQTVDPASYPSIIKENLSAVLMAHIAKALPALPPKTRADVMSGIADVSRFKLVWMLLPPATKKLYAAAYKEMQQGNSEVSPDVLQKLVSSYKF